MAANKRQFFELLRKEIDTALGAVVDCNSDALVSLKLGRITYNADGFSVKLEGVFKGGRTREGQAYESWRAIYSTENKLTLPELGAVVTLGGEGHKVVGANRNGRIILERVRDNARLILRRAETIAVRP